MRHIANLVRTVLQQFRELAAPNTTFFPVTHKGLDLLCHTFDVETEGIEKGSHSFKLQRFDNW